MPDTVSTASCKGLCIPLDDVEDAVLVPQAFVTGGSVTAKVVHGADASLMVAKRQPGYHSKPHIHDAEQLNYVLEGDIWIFLDSGGFHARTGDVFRIPRNAVHWSRVGESGCTLLEVHAPSLIGDATVAVAAHGLFAPDEPRGDIQRISTGWRTEFDRDAVEARVKAEIGA